MRCRFLLFSVIFSFALTSQRAAAQLTPDGGPTSFGPGNLRLHGRVISATSNASIQNARIELRTFTGQLVAITSSNSNGEFIIPGLGTGNYVIEAKQQGFRTTSETLEVNSMEGMGDVILTMRPEVNAKVAPPGDPVSARLLNIPQRAQDAYAKGVKELYDKKDPEASLPYFALALKGAPEFYEAYFQTGVAYRDLGRNEEAEPAFRKTIELSKGRFYEANFRLASLLGDLKKYSEAETLVRQGLAVEPKSWLGNFELGRDLVSLHKPDEAEKSLRKALEENPRLAKAYLLLANIHLARKEPAAVVEDLDNFLRLNPEGPQSAQARRVREQAQQQLDQAKKATPPSTPPPQH
jgi:Tfp pilus assembly protein PilF